MGNQKRDWQLTPKQQNVYQNLWKQVEKAFNFSDRSGQGYRGKERYRRGLSSFCKHLAIQYNSKNFRNITDKHLQSFIESSKIVGLSPKTLKTDLSAIRKLHHKTADTRYQLSTNEKLGYTDKRQTRGIDRAWRDNEVKKAMDLAHSMGRYEVKWSIGIARHMGLRVEEVTALNKTQLRDALNKGYLSLRTTKGGIPRDVPISQLARAVFREVLTYAEGEKVFIKHGRQHHQAFKSIQNWIGNYRWMFQDSYEADGVYLQQMKIEEERPSLTMHGLRHAYARERYQEFLEIGIKPKQARQEVAELLGHGRDDVTRIYLG